MKLVLAILFSAINVFAIPTKIHYSGQLADDSGQPLDSVVAITFHIYGAASGGTSVWSESHPAVSVASGVLNVTLGSVTPIPDLFSVPRWLGVQIGSDSEMVPREQITSVAHAYRVATIDGTSGGTISSSVVVGEGSAEGEYSLCVGGDNSANGDGSSVTGGYSNTADGNESHVGGGTENWAGDRAIVAGGEHNEASGILSAIAGGSLNKTLSAHSAILGGHYNHVTGDNSVICGGIRNVVTGRGSFIGGGDGTSFLTDSNQVDSDLSCIVGGFGNWIRGYASAIGGGGHNVTGDNGRYMVIGGGLDNFTDDSASCVLGGIDNSAQGDYSAVVGGRNNHADARMAFIGGGLDNSVTGAYSSIICGRSNQAEGDSSTIVSGSNNWTSSQMAFIGGGLDNVASAGNAVIVGGSANLSSGTHAFIGGGNANIASGQYSTVPGGQSNQALGNYSVAMGHQAQANNAGSFVYADNSGSSFTSSASNQFNVRAAGGVRIYTNAGLTSGVTMAAGSGSWVSVSDSTKKRDIHQSDSKTVLEKVASLPIKNWEYQSEVEGIEHIGPMAQDFWNTFKLGSDSLGIATIDADGVLFAAAKELAIQNSEKDKKIEDLEARVKQLEAAILQFGSLNKSDKQ